MARGTCTIRSQASQFIFGRTWRISLKQARTCSRISATSSPRTLQLATAVRAGLMVRHMGMDLKWQMLRQRSAGGLGGDVPSGRRGRGAFLDGIGPL
jgi:hypothetical protein